MVRNGPSDYRSSQILSGVMAIYRPDTVRPEQDYTGSYSYSLPDGLRAELYEVAIANTPTISLRGILRHMYIATAGTAIGYKWLVTLNTSSLPH